MIRSSSAPGGVAAAAITVLALTAGLWAAAPAQADNSDTGPGCGLVCGLLPGDQKAQPTGPGTGKPTAPPSAAPSSPPPAAPAPAPTAPPVPAAPAPASVPTVAPEPLVSPVQQTPTPEATNSIAPSAASASPSAEASPSAGSNWDTPVTKSAKPTQAAAVSRNDGSGLFGSPRLVPIMAGVLLVGVAGLAFAWWGRNRFSAH